MRRTVWLLAWLAAATPLRAETALDIRHLPAPLLATLKVTPDCSPLDNVVMERAGVTRLKAPDGAEIYRVSCWASETNLIQRYFTIANDVATPLLFALYTDKTGWTGTAELPGSRFDEASGLLVADGKPDQSGICGMSGRWLWRDGGFRLIELRAQPGCVGSLDPAQWPIVFTAKEP